MKRLWLCLPLLLLAVPALAEDRPLLSATRLSAALGVNHVWLKSSDALLLTNEFEVGPYLAYNLLAAKPDAQGHTRAILSLGASTAYGLDSKITRTSVGLRLVLYSGGR